MRSSIARHGPCSDTHRAPHVARCKKSLSTVGLVTVDAKGSDGAFSLRVPIAKLDEDQHLAFGVVATVEDADGRPIIDHQGDIISVAELERAAYDYVLTSGDAGLMHESSGVGTLVESFVVTKAKREAYGFGPGPTFWHVGYKVHSEDVWKRLKSGEVRELSLEGSAFRDETKVDG